MKNFHPELESFLGSISTAQLSSERQQKLAELALLIKKVRAKHDHVNLNFICTHNSRRSQIAELTLRMCAYKSELNYLSSFSGGTEATALNFRVANALSIHGFQVNKVEEGENPIYAINFSEEREEEPAMFSKKFDDDSNPEHIIAIMVCGDAEENCPYIPTAEHRFPLTYEDPKYSDDSENESEVYQNKIVEIGSEMNYLCQLLDS